jgi:integrase
MDKDDIFKMVKRYKQDYSELTAKNFSRFPSDCKMVGEFIKAKTRGGYRNIVYDCNAPEKTCYKNIGSLKKLISLVNKPLIELDEEDLLKVQDILNKDEVYSLNKRVKISYSYKKDIVKTFKQFWIFYMEYSKHELKKEVPLITLHFRLRKPKNSNRIVEFLTIEDISRLVNLARNLKMRAFIKVFFETGARAIEIMNLKRFNCQYDEAKKKWLIRLPNMKGISTAKMPIEIDYAHIELNEWLNSREFQPDDFVFDYSYAYVKYYFYKRGKILGKHICPKMIRKSCAMYLVNQGVNEQYIKGHMGWSAGSKSIAHYINQTAIKKPEQLTLDLKKRSEPTLGNQQILEMIKKLEGMLVN